MVECIECNNQCWVEFQLVDPHGSGEPYAGLEYVLIDNDGEQYQGTLDANGSAKQLNITCGGVILRFQENYRGDNEFYKYLSERDDYPLPITQLQYVAEQTAWLKKDEFELVRDRYTNVNDNKTYHDDVEVRHLVEHIGHLPIFGDRSYRRNDWTRCEIGFAGMVRGMIPPNKKAQIADYGFGLEPNKRHVLKIKPLRAYRPVLSISDSLSPLNVYQLSLLAALSYSDFEEQIIPDGDFFNPVANGYYFAKPTGAGTVNSIFISELANHYESGVYGESIGDKDRFGLLLEEVPYSKRFEIVPFDPTLYPANKLHFDALNNQQPPPDEAETPKKIHFFDDTNEIDGMNTQGFMTHSDQIVLISIRGTQEGKDLWTDVKGIQVQMEGYPEDVYAHLGFYKSFKAIKGFIEKYLSRFYSNQKIIVVGHSLGAAIATLAADWIKTIQDITNVILYTYGSPRVGNPVFVKQSTLIHYRIVAEDDPVPSVPGERLSFQIGKYSSRKENPPKMKLVVKKVEDSDDISTSLGYKHHGILQHFTALPIRTDALLAHPLLWSPGCKGGVYCTSDVAAPADLPERSNFMYQIIKIGDHLMFRSYIPFAHSLLVKYLHASELGLTAVTKAEVEMLKALLNRYRSELINIENNRFDGLEYTEDNQLDPYFESFLSYSINEEIKHVERDIVRANTLPSGIITPVQVFGEDVAMHPDLKQISQKWKTKDNQFASKKPKYVRVTQLISSS